MHRTRRLVALAGVLVLATAAFAHTALAQGEQAPTTRMAVCPPAPRPFDPSHIDLTGAWAADDRGIYYLTQILSTVWWSGMSDLGGPADLLGRGFNNVAMGTLATADNRLTLQWSDVPRGFTRGYGVLSLQVEADANGNIQLRRIYDTGNFGGSLWTPCAMDGGGPPATLPPDGTYQAVITKEDLNAAGAFPGDDDFLAGTAIWTFEAGTFSFGSGKLAAADCGGTYRALGSVVRLLFNSANGCEGMDDVRVVIAEDGSTMKVTWVACGPDGCSPGTDRAVFERVWTKTE